MSAKSFTPVPALQVNNNTCGQCHVDHVYNVRLSMMNSVREMKAIAWNFGIGTKTTTAFNSTLVDTDGETPNSAPDNTSIICKRKLLSRTIPSELKIPTVSAEDIKTNPELAAFTYLRNCNAVTLATKIRVEGITEDGLCRLPQRLQQ